MRKSIKWGLVFLVALSIAGMVDATDTQARDVKIITIGSPVFHKSLEERRLRLSKNGRKYIRRRAGLGGNDFDDGDDDIDYDNGDDVNGDDVIFFITGFRAAKRCNLYWHEANGHGYRKMHCKSAPPSRFPADRPWAYREFRETAGWDQSRAWQGRFHPHDRYKGDLEQTDHSRLIQGDPYQYLDNPFRYEQSPQFGQKIFYPRAPWE